MSFNRASICSFALLFWANDPALTVVAQAPIESETIEEVRSEIHASTQDDRPPRPPNSQRQRPRPPRSSNRASQNQRRSTETRLARLPYIFGDNSLSVFAFTGADDVSMRLPFYGVSEHLKFAENGAVVPGNRTYINYNHFHNAIQFDRGPPAVAPTIRESFHIDSYVLGWERASSDGTTSTEVRLPFMGNLDLALSSPGGNPPDFILDSGNVGNLGVIRKRVLFQDDRFASTVGMGISLPTGQDMRVELPSAARSIVVQNSSVHILPFIAFASAPNQNGFVQAIIQLDVDLNGNRIDVQNTTTSATSTGVWQNQTMLFADFSAGHWLWQNRQSLLRAVASVVELHYTTALENSDRVNAFGGVPTFQNLANRIDVLNMTFGIHIETVRNTAIRIGATFPLMDAGDRFFDGEVQLQVVTRPF